MFPSARVFAFEADPRNFKVVVKNVGFRKQITPLPYAAFDFTGQGVFHASGIPLSGENPTASGSLLMPASKFREAFPNITFEHDFMVETTTLADWSRQNGITGIDLIWMDAQGSELRILKGMGDLLRSVRAILLEVWTECYYEEGSRLGEIQEYLEKSGFRQNRTWLDGDNGDALFQKE